MQIRIGSRGLGSHPRQVFCKSFGLVLSILSGLLGPLSICLVCRWIFLLTLNADISRLGLFHSCWRTRNCHIHNNWIIPYHYHLNQLIIYIIQFCPGHTWPIQFTHITEWKNSFSFVILKKPMKYRIMKTMIFYLTSSKNHKLKSCCSSLKKYISRTKYLSYDCLC